MNERICELCQQQEKDSVGRREQESLDNGKKGRENLRAKRNQTNRSDPLHHYFCWDTHSEGCFLHKGRNKGILLDPAKVSSLHGWHCTGFGLFSNVVSQENCQNMSGRWHVSWPELAHGSHRVKERTWWLRPVLPQKCYKSGQIKHNMVFQTLQLLWNEVSLWFCAAHGKKT